MILQGMTATMDTLDRRYLTGPDRYRYGFPDEGSLRRYSSDPANRLSSSFLDHALARGDLCFAIRDGERLAAFSWYSSQPTRIKEDLLVTFSPEWMYVHRGHTLEEYRGRR